MPSQTEINEKKAKLANSRNKAIEAKFIYNHNVILNPSRTRAVTKFASKNPNYIKETTDREERFKARMKQEKAAKEEIEKQKQEETKAYQQRRSTDEEFNKVEREREEREIEEREERENRIYNMRRKRGDNIGCYNEPFEEWPGHKRVIMEGDDCGWKSQNDQYIHGGYIKRKTNKKKTNKKKNKRKTRTRK